MPGLGAGDGDGEGAAGAGVEGAGAEVGSADTERAGCAGQSSSSLSAARMPKRENAIDAMPCIPLSR